MHKFLARLEVAPENHSLWGVINFSFFVTGIIAILMGVLLPYLKAEHALSYTQTGLMFSSHQLGTFCAVLAAGVLPYVIGRKQAVLLLVSGAVFGLVMAVFVQHFYLLILAFALTGIFRGVLNNACNVITADISGNPTAAMNVLHSGWAFGAIISPVIVFVWVFAIGASGWKAGTLTVALLAGVTWLLFLRAKLPKLPPKREKGASLSFLREASFWIPTVLLLCYVAVESSIIGWFVLYFIDAGTLPHGLADFVPTVHWTMMTAGRISIALISHRIRNKNRALVAMALSTAICFGGMLLSSSALLSMIFLLGIGLSMAGIYPTTIATMKGATSSVSLGFTVAISGLGGIFMPGIVGAVADARGITEGIVLVLAVSAVMALFALFKIINERPKRET